jgi:hypothetical protein
MWRVFYCHYQGGEADVKYTKPALSFEQQADQLLKNYPDIPLHLAGFSPAWHTSPIWK